MSLGAWKDSSIQSHCLGKNGKIDKNGKKTRQNKNNIHKQENNFESDFSSVIIPKRKIDMTSIVLQSAVEAPAKSKPSDKVKFILSHFDNSLVGVPDRFRMKMKYSDENVQSHSSGALDIWNFRANSLFDPDFTYSGHQPLGFDELAALYGKYKVTHCSIRVSAVSLDGVNNMLVILPRRTTTALSNFNQAVELPRSRAKLLAPTAVPSETLSFSYDMADLFGSPIKDQDFGALVSANPSNVLYYTVITGPTNQASTSTVQLHVELEFTAEFYLKNQLSQS